MSHDADLGTAIGHTNSLAPPVVGGAAVTERRDDYKQFYRGRAKEFVELHEQVQTSVSLLDSLESFLSTFQKDLSAVSGQICDLQGRSKDLDNKLKSRRKIEKPLSSLITDITIPPALATIILNSDVDESWIPAIGEFERHLEICKDRTRVKAARDLAEVAEGLRIVAATKLRAFFLVLLQPIRTSVTTNMAVLQTSILLKYQPLFGFLQRQAPTVAHEVQRAYVGAARTYYETGFRRYSRTLSWIKARTADKLESIATAINESGGINVDLERLAHAHIDGPGVTLAFMADDKSHKEPVEALLRSLLLVLMDNAVAEYSFVTAFFNVQTEDTSMPSSQEQRGALFSPTGSLFPGQGGFADQLSHGGSDFGENVGLETAGEAVGHTRNATKAEQATLDAIWKHVLDPVLEYCQTFVRSVLDPIPQIVPLLTMIRLTEDVIAEIQKRDCPPLEKFVFGIRLQMWPVFQKAMSEQIDTVKKLAEGSTNSYFARAAATTDIVVSSICQRYAVLFNSFVILTPGDGETMIFSNLLRLRQELTKLIAKHTERSITDSIGRATAQSNLYDGLLHCLSRGTHLSTHPKFQQETAYWAGKEEDARRRIVSVSQRRSKAG